MRARFGSPTGHGDKDRQYLGPAPSVATRTGAAVSSVCCHAAAATAATGGDEQEVAGPDQRRRPTPSAAGSPAFFESLARVRVALPVAPDPARVAASSGPAKNRHRQNASRSRARHDEAVAARFVPTQQTDALRRSHVTGARLARTEARWAQQSLYAGRCWRSNKPSKGYAHATG